MSKESIFDDITRLTALAGGEISRRRAISWILGTVVYSTLGSFGLSRKVLAAALGCCTPYPGALCVGPVSEQFCTDSGGQWLAGGSCCSGVAKCYTPSPSVNGCCIFSNGGCQAGSIDPNSCLQCGGIWVAGKSSCILNSCCPIARVCGATCCNPGEICLNNTACCPPGQVCGTNCCSPDQDCKDNTCVPKFTCDSCPPNPCPCAATTYKAAVIKPDPALSLLQSSPHTQLRVTLQNAVNGISTIALAKAVNCEVPGLPMDAGGDKNPIVLIATKLDETKSASVAFKVVPGPGSAMGLMAAAAPTTCAECPCTPNPDCPPIDPVFTTLKINTGRWVRQTFTDIPQAESYISVTNGDPGLKKLGIRVNSQYHQTLTLEANETRTVNAADAMEAGDHNTISLTGRGEPGGSADIAIMDIPPSGLTGNAMKTPGVALASANGQSHRHNTVWGNLVEEIEETGDLHGADASRQTVRVIFTGAVDSNAASDSGLYTVTINGNPAFVQAANAQQRSEGIELILQLPKGTLKKGDKVEVYWDDLLDTEGRPLAGHVSLIAQRLH